MTSLIEQRTNALELALKYFSNRPINDIFSIAHDINKFIQYGLDEPVKLASADDDPILFAERCFVRSIDGSEGNFIPYAFQKDVLNLCKDNEKVAILNSRQMGMTTTLAIFCLWYALTKSNSKVILTSNSFSISQQSLLFIYDVIGTSKNITASINGNPISNSLIFSNGSRIDIASVSHLNFQIETSDLIWIDNASYISHALEAELMPYLVDKGRQIILSSSAGQNKGIFYGAFNNQVFRTKTLPWYLHPKRDAAWEITQRATLGEKAFEKEYNCVFDVVS